MAYVEDVDLVPELARTVAGTQVSASNFGGSTQAILHVRTTAYSGFGFTVILEDSVDGTNWFGVEQLTVSGVGNQALRVDKPFTDNLRVRWVPVSGSVGATFAVSLAAF